MRYELASSSAEEGELEEKDLPLRRSHTQYYYYPHTVRFVGKNTLPHFMNYKGENISAKMKKEIKADYPYISFNLLENSKGFFDNRFLFITDLRNDEGFSNVSAYQEAKLKNIRAEYREIGLLDKYPVPENRYDKFCQRMSRKDERCRLIRDIQERLPSNVFVLEDRVLENIDSGNAYLFFRVIEETLTLSLEKSEIPAINMEEVASGHKTVRIYMFEDIFYNSVPFYEYLRICQGILIKNHNSEEMRIYEDGDNLFIIFSETTFRNNGAIKRLYSGIDVASNVTVIINKEFPTLRMIQGRMSDNIKYLRKLGLPEGDYAIKDKRVYKISNEGELIEFGDIDYTDFMQSRWETA